MRTLIADDDPNVRGLVRRVLMRQFDSLDIAECDNGLAALELLTNGEYDLVLLDLSMPLMDGLDVLHSVRCAPAPARLPVIMSDG
jgi:CheY-like chemotaxis protein